MSKIQKKSSLQRLSNYQTFLIDTTTNSKYFKLSEVPEQLTSGKNAFLIEGSQFLKRTTDIKIEILDTEGNPVYVEPAVGNPQYYEGISKLISIYIYETTPIGIGKITILGELATYIDENGIETTVPGEWEGVYNVKWEKEIKINKILPNETRVRFIQRPSIIVEETGESFYSKNVLNLSQTTGTVKGIAITPAEGTYLNIWGGGIKYIIQNQSGSFVDNGKTISVTGTSIQNAEIVEYLNQNSVIVSVPNTSSANVVLGFSDKNYSLNYEYVSSIAPSSTFGSFARFEVNSLATFAGDVERLKVYAKSRASMADYYLLHEAKIDSTNLLSTVISGSEQNLGYFQNAYLNGYSYTNYWTTQSSANISLDSNSIYKAVKFRNNKITSNLGEAIRLEKGSEYTLQFYVYYSGSVINNSDQLKVYISSTTQTSPFTSNFILTGSIVNLYGDTTYKTAQKLSYNFIPESTDNWSINFEAINAETNTYWHVGSVILEGSNELGYSPDEYTFTIPIQRQLQKETFDFRFEFYDINNNYIPVLNTATQTFVSGNLSLLGKNLTIDTDKSFFTFDENSYPTPISQVVSIFGTKTRISGSLLITSQAYDTGGLYIPNSSFVGGNYPGKLTNIAEDIYSYNAQLNIAEFTGSMHGSPPGPGNIIVDRILYTFTDANQTEPSVRRVSINRSLSNVNFVLSASHANTASYAPAYLPLTGGTINGNVTLNGTASIAFLNVTYESSSVIISTGSNVFGDAANDSQTLYGTVSIPTGSFSVSGSMRITGSLRVTTGITGSMLGTSSYAVTASYVTGSIFTGINSAASASYAVTASYSLNGGAGGSISTTGSTLYSTDPLTDVGSSTFRSIFLGELAGYQTTNANNSNFFGFGAGYQANYSELSNFFGYQSGYQATYAADSNFFGTQAGYHATNAGQSNFFGNQAGNSASNANDSNFFGYQSGYLADSANYSTFIGYSTGYNPLGSVGSNNIIIGTNITLAKDTVDSVNIGGIIFGTGTYNTVGGNPFSGSMTTGRIGINKSTPIYNLDVSGSGNYSNGLVVTGSMLITGSLTIYNLLALMSQSVLPTTGIPSGSFMTSGSGTNLKPYFWNGDTWTALF